MLLRKPISGAALPGGAQSLSCRGLGRSLCRRHHNGPPLHAPVQARSGPDQRPARLSGFRSGLEPEFTQRTTRTETFEWESTFMVSLLNFPLSVETRLTLPSSFEPVLHQGSEWRRLANVPITDLRELISSGMSCKLPVTGTAGGQRSSHKFS